METAAQNYMTLANNIGDIGPSIGDIEHNVGDIEGWHFRLNERTSLMFDGK